MNYETEQRLATLEVILDQKISFYLPCHEDSANFQPYVWDATSKGVFTPLNLVRSQGWIEETDLETAFTQWIEVEKRGSVSELIPFYGNDPDPGNIFLDDKVRQARYQVYSELFDLLIDRLENLQAFKFSCNSHYSLTVVVGKIIDSEKWICLSSTVPQETPKYINDVIYCSTHVQSWKYNLDSVEVSPSETKINEIVTRLDNIKIYGYYGGGYCHTHDFKIIKAVQNSKNESIERALLLSGLVEIYRFEKFAKQARGGWGFSRHFDLQKQSLANFLNKAFPELLVYRFCFWDYEHLYILGETGDCNRVGISLHSQFTYNP